MRPALWKYKELLLAPPSGAIQCDEPLDPEVICDCNIEEAQAVAKKYLDLKDDDDNPLWIHTETIMTSYAAGRTSGSIETEEMDGETYRYYTYKVTRRATGSLIPAFKANEKRKMGVFEEHETLTYAIILTSNTEAQLPPQQPKTLIIGCRCSYKSRLDKELVKAYDLSKAEIAELRPFRPMFAPDIVVMENYVILGTVSHADYPEDMEEDSIAAIGYFCLGDPCEVYHLQLKAAQQLLGGTLHEEGFVVSENLTSSSDPFLALSSDPFIITPQRYALEFSADGEDFFALVDCDCTGISLRQFADNEEWASYPGACTEGECVKLKFILELSGYNMSDMHGVVFRRMGAESTVYNIPGSDCCDYYALHDKFYSADPEGGVYITCDCHIIFATESGSCPQRDWEFRFYAGACDCIDYRLIAVDAADLLGITEFSWGSNTTYHAVIHEPFGGGYTYEVDRVCHLWTPHDGSDQMNHGYLDYDILYFFFRRCDGSLWLGYADRDSMGVCSYDNGTLEAGYAGPFLSGEFTGHLKPFTAPGERADGLFWRCPFVGWQYWYEYYGTISFATEEEADAWIAQAPEPSTTYILCGLSNYYQGPCPSKLEPSFPHEIIPVQKQHDPSEPYSPWIVDPAHAEATDEYAYCINYLETSRGFIINGVDGYHETIDIQGILAYWDGDPNSWLGPNCYGHNGVPWEDTTLVMNPRGVGPIADCSAEQLQAAWGAWGGNDPLELPIE